MLANMREAWWIPVASVPVEENPMGRVLINGQRTLPHSIMVNKRGRRFTNEAANYNAFGGAFHVEDVSRFEYANLPCWLVFDQNYAEKYGFRVAPGVEAKASRRGCRAATRRPTWPPRDRCRPEGLTTTIERWNAQCADGHDPDFGRGDSAFDRWWGDPHLQGQARGDARSARPPARTTRSRSTAAALGTKGGPQVTATPGSLDLDGKPIPGLYAAGNVMGSPFGMTYGGPGGTLGPAMVFGYLAALHAAAELGPHAPSAVDAGDADHLRFGAREAARPAVDAARIVDHQRVAADVARLVAGQIERGVGDVERVARPPVALA